MPPMLRTLRLTVRALAGALLLVGLLIWLGYAAPWRAVHQTLGLLLAIAVIAIGVVSARATRRASPLVVTVLWTVIVVAYGIAQARLLPGSAHWVAQLVHVFTGLATIGVAERVAAGAVRPVAVRA